jgi:hypothetical protein
MDRVAASRPGFALGTTGHLLATTALGVVAGLLLTLGVTSGGGPGAVTAGPWITWPRGGAPDADPYTRAILARRGELPMGLGEGLAFMARTDSGGYPLSGVCTYRVRGPMPAGRNWTLAAYDSRGRLMPNPSGRHGLTSSEAVRDAEGTVAVTVAPFPAGGNWLPVGQTGEIVLILRLYETPLTAAAGGLVAADLPEIVQEGCR